MVHLSEEILHIFLGRIDAYQRHRSQKLMQRNNAVAICIPLTKEVHHLDRIGGERALDLILDGERALERESLDTHLLTHVTAAHPPNGMLELLE